MEKVVFFFGAGAEVPYGIPCGGEFTLEILRSLGKEDKDSLRYELAKVEETSRLADWFPLVCSHRIIIIFEKNDFDNILSPVLEIKRDDVINTLTNFDAVAESVKNEFLNLKIDIDEVIKYIGYELYEIQYGREIILNEHLNKKYGEQFFSSAYLSILIQTIRDKKFSEQRYDQASTLLRSFIEIFVAAIAKNRIRKFNNGLFKRAPNDLDCLGEIAGIFYSNYQKAGVDGLAYLVKLKPFAARLTKISKDTPKDEILLEFYTRIAEIVYNKFIDYQILVNSYYHYLYKPKRIFDKFCKISTFLFAVKRYLTNKCAHRKEINGYYEDIKHYQDKIDVIGIGTSNYTDLVNVIDSGDKYYLNGSLDEYYDPYKNELVTSNTSFTVPCIFTQSAITPLTSLEISRRYINFYDRCREADRIVVLGYGFNAGDGQIDTIFRSLIDNCDKQVDVIAYKEQDTMQRKKEILDNLRCSKKSLNVYALDQERKIADLPWLEYLFESN